MQREKSQRKRLCFLIFACIINGICPEHGEQDSREDREIVILTMRLKAGCEICFEIQAPTPFVLMLRPRSGYGQWIAQEGYSLSPRAPVVEYMDSYGNLCQRLVAPPGCFVIQTEVQVETADNIDVAPGAPLTPVQELPDTALQFLLPSRYCPSDLLGELAVEITQGAAPGYDQPEAIRA
jgi:hypothetical protein